MGWQVDADVGRWRQRWTVELMKNVEERDCIGGEGERKKITVLVKVAKREKGANIQTGVIGG